MYDKKTLTHLVKVACKEPDRPSINGVRFEHKRAIATDSYHLLEVENPNGIHPDAKPFTLHHANVREVIKQLSAKNETLMCDSDKHTRCGVDYPNVDPLLGAPVGEQAITINVNPQFLVNIAEAFKGCAHVSITIEDPKKPLRFAGKVQDNKARALLMPIYLDR